MSAAEPATIAATALPTGTWKVDPVHSSVEFHVKHLGIATVKGQFKEFEGTLEVGPDGARASGTVQVASVDTREPQRDAHLRSADFFDADTNPQISFSSTAIRQLDEESFEIEGELSIHGVTRRSRCRRLSRGPRPTTKATPAWVSPRTPRSAARTTTCASTWRSAPATWWSATRSRSCSSSPPSRPTEPGGLPAFAKRSRRPL